jgi:DNA-binding NarL/FixJ family response regulator
MRHRPDIVSPAGQTMRIMVVAGFALFRRGLAELIRQVLPDGEIAEAADLEVAARLLAEWPADVLLVDFETEALDARPLLQRLRLERPEVKVAVLGSASDRVSALSWLEAGAHGCVPKSASLEELCDALRTIRAGHGYVSSSLLAVAPVALPVMQPPRRTAEPLPLTARQQDVLRLLAEGRATKDIARRLGLSVSTVKAHLAAVYRSVGARNRLEAVVRCREAGQAALG